jgi:hypothetical protein
VGKNTLKSRMSETDLCSPRAQVCQDGEETAQPRALA